MKTCTLHYNSMYTLSFHLLIDVTKAGTSHRGFLSLLRRQTFAVVRSHRVTATSHQSAVLSSTSLRHSNRCKSPASPYHQCPASACIWPACRAASAARYTSHILRPLGLGRPGMPGRVHAASGATWFLLLVKPITKVIPDKTLPARFNHVM